MRADRYEALLDFLLEAVSDQGTTPFPAHVLAGMRQVAGCETVSYREWSPQELLEQSLAADEPEAIMGLWPGYRQVRHEDPLPGGARRGSPLPDREWLGQALTISDFISDRQFRRGGLYAEMCKPLGVRAVRRCSCQPAGQPARHSCSKPPGAGSPTPTGSPCSVLSRTWCSCGATRTPARPISRF